jgi:phospholipase/carboxylesterase
MWMWRDVQGLKQPAACLLAKASQPPWLLGTVPAAVHMRSTNHESGSFRPSNYQPRRCRYLAPQASGNSWYPNSFLAPVAANQPWLSSALGKVQSIVDMLVKSGIGTERVAIGGFSQGACLATEFAASHAKRYAGLFALTGGLIGPMGGELTHGGDLAGTPAFFGSSDPDPHVPWSRVQESAQIFETMGANVRLKRYENRAHTISGDELEIVHQLLVDAFFPANSLPKR